MTDTTAISALTALLAVLLGPLVSLYVVRRQFGAQVLSTNRQDWVNTLRDELAALASLVSYYSMASTSGSLTSDAAATLQQRAYERWAKIRLLINPTETDHTDLIAAIDLTLANMYIGKPHDPAEVRRRLEDLIAKAQTVLKREWERVKKGV